VIEALNAVSPFIATMGAGGGTLVVVGLLYRFYKDVLAEYRVEVKERQKQVNELEKQLKKSQTEYYRCVREREMMRTTLKVEGVPWTLEDWE
jgi:hypothetical protein